MNNVGEIRVLFSLLLIYCRAYADGIYGKACVIYVDIDFYFSF